MLTVYAFSTPNSVKVPIALEELGLPYELRSVNIRKGEQKAADYLALNPNGKVPLLAGCCRMWPWHVRVHSSG
jgi:GSH-dependent disulfide-bond oxidoreductase